MSNSRPGPRGFCRPWLTTNVKRAAPGSDEATIAGDEVCEIVAREKLEKRLGFIRLVKRAITNVVLGAGIFSKKSMVL
jgi:hypothetical protein